MSSLVYSNSWVEIANMALGRLGSGSLDTLADGTQLATYVNLYLGNTVEAVLGGHDWHALRKRAELSPLATSPVYGFDYAYQLPTDFIRLIDIDCDDEDFSFESDTILTDAYEVFITYIYRPTDDISAVPGYLKKAIASELAYQLSVELRSSETTSNRVLQESSRDMQMAVKADGRKQQSKTRTDREAHGYHEEVR